MVTYSRIVFPLRTISLLSLYIVLNTILYARDNVARKYVLKNIEYSIYTHPSLPEDFYAHVNQGYRSFGDYKKYVRHIIGWISVADICIVFLLVCLVFGFMANYPYKTIFLSILHFIGIILCTHMILYYESINFLICAVVFGIFLPTFIECYNLIMLLVFKKDFYVPRK